MNRDQHLRKMFHPQSYLATKELTDRVFLEAFGDAESGPAKDLIPFSFDLFHGRNPRFQACDTAFHDFDHTMQATGAVAELLASHRRRPLISPLTQRDWHLAIAAVILHDTGYLKFRDDLDGSGAKYSAIHVGRSCFFAWDLLPAFGFNRDELRQIQNAISATAISQRMKAVPFRDSREWLIGAIVATGDMLGQMAAEDYPERLAGLYLEFREATHFSRFQKTSFAVHKNLLDLLEGTEKFFSGYAMHMLEHEWNGIYRVLNDQRGNNRYLERIRANISRVNLMARSLAATKRNPVIPRFLE
jgi:hypothetical protein